MNDRSAIDKIKICTQKSPNLDELKSMWTQAFDDLPEEDVRRLGKENLQGLDGWFSLEEMTRYQGELLESRTTDGRLVGAAFIGKQNPITWEDGKKAEVFIIGVLPEFRGIGLGRMLLAQAENNSRKFGAEKVILSTNAALFEDQKFYQKSGYQSIGTLKDYYGNGNAVFFLKDLTKHS